MTKYVESTYAKIATEYAEQFFDGTSDLPLVKLLTDRLSIAARVLDIGCGPGQFTKLLIQHGFVTEGIDTTEEMLVIARQKVLGARFVNMDMRRLKYPDQFFDGILAAYSIIHMPTDELPGVLAEMRRVMKKNGYALFIVQQGDPDQILDEPLAAGEKIFANFFSIERLSSLLTDSGFVIVNTVEAEQASGDVLSNKVIAILASPR